MLKVDLAKVDELEDTVHDASLYVGDIHHGVEQLVILATTAEHLLEEWTAGAEHELVCCELSPIFTDQCYIFAILICHQIPQGAQH